MNAPYDGHEERLAEDEPGNCVVCGEQTRYRWVLRCAEHMLREPERDDYDE